MNTPSSNQNNTAHVRRRPNLEQLGHGATVFAALCGFLAFCGQVIGAFRGKAEVITVVSAQPRVADDGRLHLRIALINNGSRTLFVRRVELVPDTADDNLHRISNQPLRNLVFVRDTSIEIAPGDARYLTSSAIPIRLALLMTITSDIAIQTTRREFFRPVRALQSEDYREIVAAVGNRATSIDSVTAERLRARIALECAGAQADTMRLQIIDNRTLRSTRLSLPLLLSKSEICFPPGGLEGSLGQLVAALEDIR